MKNKNFYKYLGLLLVVIITSCSNFTDGINEDPNNFTTAPGDLLIGQTNLAIVKMASSQNARVAGMWTDQFCGCDRQYITLGNNYLTTSGDYDDDWNDIYANGLAQAILAEQTGAESGDALLEGVSQILQGMMIGEVAALWGDAPWTEALDLVNFPDPNYDSQTSLFESAQSLLSAGITNVGSASVAAAYGAPVYESNSALWAEIGHSLKARYYLVAKNYPSALTEAQLGISSRSGDLMSAHADATGAKNLFYQFVREQREGYLTADNSHLYNIINGTTARVLNTPGDANRNYFDGTELNTQTDGYFAVDAGFPIVSFYETKLIEAEAAHRTGGDALTPFNEVRTELATQYGGSFPHSTSSGATLLEEILEEKYVTLIGSTQVFHDVRRTNNLIGVPIKNTTQGNTTIPQRFLYPQTEVDSNSNFPGFVDLFEPTSVNQ